MAEALKSGDGLTHETRLLFSSFTMSKATSVVSGLLARIKREIVQAPQNYKGNKRAVLLRCGAWRSPLGNALNVVVAMRKPKKLI